MVTETAPVSTEELQTPSTPEPTPQSAQPTPTEPESSTPESTPEDDDSSFDALLKEHGFTTEEGTSETTGSPSSTDSPAPEIKALTPEQAYQKGLEDQRQSLLQYNEAQQRTNRENGVRNAFLGARDRRLSDMTSKGYPVDDVLAVQNDWNQAYGQVGTYIESEVRDANSLYQQNVTQGLYQVAAHLAGKEIADRQSSHAQASNSTQAFLEDFAKAYAAKNGLLTPKEAKDATAKEVKAWVKKLPPEARTALGWKPSSTNSSNVSGTGSGKLTKELAESLPVSELIKRQAR